MNDLLDPAFLGELEALRRRLEIKARSGAAGDSASRRRGGSAEFQDHRPYAPGDDLRRVDWAVYARTGEPVVKLFRMEEDALVRVLVDASKSLAYGTPTKLDTARRMAAAIGYMALASGQRAQVIGVGEGVRALGRSGRGRGALAAFLRNLEALEPSGGTDLARALDSVLGSSTRPGMIVVLSDFLDPGSVT